MLVKKMVLVFCLICISTITTPLWGNTKIVRLATSVDYSPFSFRKGIEQSIIAELISPGADSTVLQGYSWDVVRESFHSRGYTIQLTVAPWARALMYMESQDVDLLFPTAFTEKRAQKYYFSKEEIHKVNLLVYILKDSTLIWNGLASLYGKPVAIIRGFSAGPIWEQQSLIEEYPVTNIKQAFGMLDKKRVVAFVTNDIVTDDYLVKNEMTDKYTKLPSFDVVIEYLAGMKANPNSLELIDVFDAGKTEIKRNDILNKINQKWGVEY